MLGYLSADIICILGYSPELGNIRPRDAFRPIARERKCLMDGRRECQPEWNLLERQSVYPRLKVCQGVNFSAMLFNADIWQNCSQSAQLCSDI